MKKMSIGKCLCVGFPTRKRLAGRVFLWDVISGNRNVGWDNLWRGGNVKTKMCYLPGNCYGQ